MKLRIRGGEDGQALAQTAITMFLLLAIVSLAIDVGFAYAERRHMQNAADAGALAGAWELCFGDPAQWQSTALDYAINRNGAGTAEAYLDDWIVQVIARKNVQTFLAGIVGISTVEVAAVAEAGCGNANSGCGVWPLAFHVDRFPLPDSVASGQDTFVNCDETFYVFDDDRLEADDPACPIKYQGECFNLCDENENGNGLEPLCDCDIDPDSGAPPPDNQRLVLHPGSRGWVRMPKAQVDGTPWEDQLPCDPSNCGANALKCWLEFGGYAPPFDVEGKCFRDLPGVIGAVEKPIDRFIEANEDPIAKILIWDEDCETTGDDLPEGWEFCGGPAARNYHVVGFGCIEVLDYEKKFDMLMSQEARDFFGEPPGTLCMKNIKVIEAKRRCDCDSACGTTTGPPVPGGVNAVNLLR